MRQVLVAERYRLCEQLGVGGMGRVWRARDEVLHRDVAIKEVSLPAGLTPEELAELRARTMREARTAARLNHPNVVQIYDVLLSDDRPWIVMEYVPSRSLYDVLRQIGQVTPEQAASIGLAVLSALRAAHAAGVLHRDVKPGNVLLAADGRVVLTDFGLAVFDSGEGSVTRPGLVLGSPQYVAPERARDGVSSPEADLWSLGATLYAAVEGHAPYARSSAMATLTALATTQHDPPTRAGALKPVLDGLLRRNPRTRMRADAAERLLRRVAEGEGGSRRLPRQRRSDALAAAAGPPADGEPTADEDETRFTGTAAVRTFEFRRLYRRWWIIAGTAAVVLAVPVVVVLLNARDPVDPASGSQPVDAGSATPSAARPVAAVGPVDCTGPEEPVPPPKQPHNRDLLTSWVWYDDPSGFSIAVPEGWAMIWSQALVCFRKPGQPSLLAVEAWRHDTSTIVAHWQRRSDQLMKAGRLPGYHQVRLEARNLYSGGADWEYTYDGDGTRLHAMARGLVTSTAQAYAIHWLSSEFDWPAAGVLLPFITASFTPPAI